LQYSNTGGAPISDISLSAITGTGATAFSIFNDACTGQTLSPGEGCIITVDFAPPSVGVFNAQFDVISTAADSPETVSLIGEGIQDDIFADRFQDN
jgi:hypothetical protein